MKENIFMVNCWVKELSPLEIFLFSLVSPFILCIMADYSGGIFFTRRLYSQCQKPCLLDIYANLYWCKWLNQSILGHHILWQIFITLSFSFCFTIFRFSFSSQSYISYILLNFKCVLKGDEGIKIGWVIQ